MSKKRKALDSQITEYTNTEGMLYETDESNNADLFKQLGALANRQKKQPEPHSVLARKDSGALTFNGWQFTRVGLTPPDNIYEDDYTAIGRLLLQLETSMQWLLGDWLKVGENREWGETYQRVASEFDFEEKTLREYAYVARNVNLSIRMDKLSFGHHQIIAKYHDNPTVQESLLEGAVREGWSIKAFRQMLKDYRPIIHQAVSENWDRPQFEKALREFKPNATRKNRLDATPLSTGAWESWGVVWEVGAKLERGNLPTEEQLGVAREQLSTIREYLGILERQLDELESS